MPSSVPPPLLTRVRALTAWLALALVTTSSAFAQAQFAGTYIGTINTRVTVPEGVNVRPV